MIDTKDRKLGMERPITRRDFLQGISLTLGALLLTGPANGLEGLGSRPGLAGDYPPARTGLRGAHDGSWETAHALRDGQSWEAVAQETGETFDLVVVGGGISGLSAAYFFRRLAGPGTRVLILDNHDDFGGHAKRNEFRSRGRLLLGYGGTQSIEAPARYSREARQLLQDLGIEMQRFYHYFDQELFRALKLAPGLFFDRETFGADCLVVGVGEPSWAEFLARTPLPETARRDLARLYDDQTVDYLRGLTVDEKKKCLAKTSYQDYLLRYVKLDPTALPFFQTQTHGLYGVGIDAVPAGDCFGLGYPGFAGLGMARGPLPGMGRSALPQDNPEPYIFHFPDGNASIARLLVRALLPKVASGSTMEDVVTARFDYGRLDETDAPVRLRLNSTAVQVRHRGDPRTSRSVAVTYVQQGKAWTVPATAVVLACWNHVIPYLCPELPAAQKQALSYGVKVPLVYTNVQLRTQRAVHQLGVSQVRCPGSYWHTVGLDFPVSLGGYQFPSSPDEPAVLHLFRTPCRPGFPAREQHKAGRYELLATPFVTFERTLRDQLARILGPAGFEPARDIEAITVNRWPHGYAYEYNSLFDPDWPEADRPCVVGRQPFGRITIANADAGAYAYTDSAIDQAYRAVREIVASTPSAPKGTSPA
jgi:spermidine dehydrogenase